ncbi:MAG: RluA family pseudouridine synthase [Parachlamydiaceae bacterium]
MSEDNDTFIISDEEAGERLDKVLVSRLGSAGSRTYFQFLIDEGRVLLNGEPAKKRIKPKSGDEVEVDYILTPELTLEAENIPLNIIYEDESIIVVDKKPGMVVHPAVGHWTGTFVNALLYYCRVETTIKNNKDDLRPGIVHRLDKETSGLIVAAKTLVAQQRLIEMFTKHTVYKEYLAVCVGNPGKGTIDVPIGRHPANRKMMAVLKEGGKAAVTHFQTLAFNEKLSLVSVVIATGRTHQIRVHMKHRGMPVLGDAIYGTPSANTKFGVERQMLHAYRLRFAHPITGEPMSFEAEIPPDMQAVAKKISFS